MKHLYSRRFHTLSRNGFQVPAVGAHAYSGAHGGPRFEHWTPPDVGPNTAIDQSLAGLRSRSRQQVRDNPTADSICDQFVINVVGTGIRPKLVIDDVELQKKIQDLWQISVNELDADGRSSFYGLQDSVARCMFEAGEVLTRRRPRRVSDGLAVPLQIQLIEPDHLDDSIDRDLGNGRRLRQGIELDGMGNRRAYHLFREHPGEFFSPRSTDRSVVPASEIAHVYRMLRIGQLRGIPHLHAALITLYNLAQYQDAELERKKQAAMKVGWIRAQLGEMDLTELFDAEDVESMLDNRDEFYKQIGRLRPGSWNVLMPGDDIEYNDPQDVGSHYQEFVKEHKREAAAAGGVTYEQASGDMEGVNYSSARVRLIDIRRGFEMIQQHVLGYQWCRVVWRWWIEAAVASGALSIPDWAENRHRYLYPEWVADAFESVDPLKDAMADVLECRAGFESRRQKQAKRGHDPDKLNKEIRRDNETADENGFVFDSDPRRTAKSGTAQDAESAAMKELIGDTVTEDN